MTAWLKPFVEGLLAEASLDAVVADGWPRAMVEAGFERHRQTWNLDVIEATLEREVVAAGGWEALRSRVPRSLAHIWPALPGAGVTPMLYAFLGGIDTQFLKASSRGENFAQRVVELGGGRLQLDSSAWMNADAVIVSGSDETVATIRERAAGRVVGYGHRVSCAVADASCSTAEIQGFAEDVVMWNQRGCFSLRAVIFVGTDDEARDFARRLAAAIGIVEERWDAISMLGEEELARAIQRRAVAEFTRPTFRARHGWVEVDENPWKGEWIAAHALSVHPVAKPEEIVTHLQVDSRHLQGIALVGRALRPYVERIGPTRICAPGMLQTPEPEWPHDGMPNFTSLLI